MIQIDDLQFHYDRAGFHLEIPSLKIAAGEKVAILGPSGSGKSTLLKLMAGAILPSSGWIRINQTSLADLSDNQRRAFRSSQIGFVFQDFELIEYLSVRENIRLPYLLNRSMRWKDEVQDRLQVLAQSAGLTHLLNRTPDKLSYGEKQRVAICRALLTTPKLILADEPTGSLDSKTGQAMMDLLTQYSDAHGAALVLVTHDLSMAGRFERKIDMASLHKNEQQGVGY